MSIYISRNNQQSGPFDEAKVLEMLRSGQLSPNDLAIRQGGNQWQRLGEMFPSAGNQPFNAGNQAYNPGNQAFGSNNQAFNAAASAQNQPAAALSPKKSRKGLLLGCGGLLVLLAVVAGVLGLLAFRNLNPPESTANLPDNVKDFKLGTRYPPKGDIWGKEVNYVGSYKNSTTSQSVLYILTEYSSEAAAKDALTSELAKTCKAGETPMYFSFMKNGSEMSQGATCAVPLYVQKDNKLVALGGSGDVDSLIEFAENLPFNDGAEMKKKEK